MKNIESKDIQIAKSVQRIMQDIIDGKQKLWKWELSDCSYIELHYSEVFPLLKQSDHNRKDSKNF
jgi:hypothetical protein